MSMGGWAVWLASQGLDVFPVYPPVDGACSCPKGPDCTCPAKHPMISGGVHSASRNIHRVSGWWEKWQDANIGMHTNQLTVLDVDGAEGLSEIRELVKTYDTGKVLAQVPRARTGSGGLHFFFLRSPVGNRVKFRPGLDVRSEGGYVILPPSLHVSGRRYTWEISLTDGFFAPMPGWLVNATKKQAPGFLAGSGAQLSKDQRLDIDSLPPIHDGGRSNGLASICGRFYAEGRPVTEILTMLNEVNRKCCVPPLETGEVENIVRSIGRYH